MNIESIGTWAGEVYKALEAADTHTLGLKQIKKATKLRKDQLMAAFGWLGREGKVLITTDDEDIVLTLTE
ncbi:MAG: winged helix-turn-helix domain-containing protein [Bacteroides sp.]|nr:winged helix-turn-helix domain-containing protein [Bacteroidales bacterium]MBD5284517.1 winged helix-turn-helix domain-containing protein [Bacteroides sp.]MBD5335728.1 winged helix-turn-helix domain-containing protein [Bacteroides sp.]